MQVAPLGTAEYYNGNMVGRYGRDLDTSEIVFVWYNEGLRSQPGWSMDPEVYDSLALCVSTVVIPEPERYHVLNVLDLPTNETTLVGRRQYLVQPSDEFVTTIESDPEEDLHDYLWITPESAHGGYHVEKNEA